MMWRPSNKWLCICIVCLQWSSPPPFSYLCWFIEHAIHACIQTYSYMHPPSIYEQKDAHTKICIIYLCCHEIAYTDRIYNTYRAHTCEYSAIQLDKICFVPNRDQFITWMEIVSYIPDMNRFYLSNFIWTHNAHMTLWEKIQRFTHSTCPNESKHHRHFDVWGGKRSKYTNHSW